MSEQPGASTQKLSCESSFCKEDHTHLNRLNTWMTQWENFCETLAERLAVREDKLAFNTTARVHSQQRPTVLTTSPQVDSLLQLRLQQRPRTTVRLLDNSSAAAVTTLAVRVITSTIHYRYPRRPAAVARVEGSPRSSCPGPLGSSM